MKGKNRAFGAVNRPLRLFPDHLPAEHRSRNNQLLWDALAQIEPQIQAALSRYGADGAKPVVGISVRDWQGWQHYKEILAEISDAIVRELDARVIFLPMQYPEDVRTAKTVAAWTKEDCTILDAEYSTSELLSLVANMDLMIGVRLHALIFAGVMGVPMIGISYDPKVDRFLRSIGEKPVNDLQDITTASVLKEVRRKWAARHEFTAANADLLAQMRTLAARNAELAMGLLRGEACC